MKQENYILYKCTRCAIFRSDALCGTWKEKLLKIDTFWFTRDWI